MTRGCVVYGHPIAVEMLVDARRADEERRRERAMAASPRPRARPRGRYRDAAGLLLVRTGLRVMANPRHGAVHPAAAVRS